MTREVLKNIYSNLDIDDTEKNLKEKIYEYNRENIRKIVRWSNDSKNCYHKMIIETIFEEESPVFLIVPSVFVKKLSVTASSEEGVGQFELLLYQKFILNEKIGEFIGTKMEVGECKMSISYQNYEIKDLVIKAGDRIIPNVEYNLQSFYIKSEANQHTTADIELEILVEELNSYIHFNRTVDAELIIAMTTTFEEKEEDIIFLTGHVISSSLYNIGKNRHFLKIHAVSISEKMDRVKKYRAFQRTTLTYQKVIEQIFSDYPNISYHIKGKRFGEEIKAPLIQFKETDWEFLVRVLSRIGIGVFCLANGSISLGFVDTSARKKKYDGEYGKIGYIRDRNQPLGYVIESEQSYSLGDVVQIEGSEIKSEGNVTISEIEYINGKFLGKYELQQREYVYPYISNKNIAGCVLEANVEKVFERDKIAVMEVNLSLGLAKYASVKSRTNENLKSYPDDKNGRYIFPYTTPYSQSNTGYFCTPETNDVVAVYFPMDEEEYGYVLWAVNNPGNGRFSNPNIRNYTTPI